MKHFTALSAALACAIAGVEAVYPHSSNPPKITKNSRENEKNYSAPMFPLLGWEKYKGNPILKPDKDYEFESAYLYNPAALVVADKLWLLYRAQGPEKISKVGLAWSDNGIEFTRYTKPVLEPTLDFEKGGVEDPRVIRHDGVFYMMYSAYDGTTARLALATSTDLVTWQKRGLVLGNNATDIVDQHADARNLATPREGWSKSGAIIPQQIDGTWYMQWGTVSQRTQRVHANAVLQVHSLKRGSDTLEFHEVLHSGNYLKVYNGAGDGIAGYKQFQYSVGQMLIKDPNGPPLARLETPIITVTEPYEENGQVNQVVFAEGLVQFRGKWRLFYGAGDQFLATATTDIQGDFLQHPKGGYPT